MTNHPAAPIDTGTRLAVDRTRLAYERTMMAWVRTATSLISFGFTIYKFFQYQTERGQAVAERLLGPREFAVLMIIVGLSGLVLASIEHHQSMKTLRATYGAMPRSTAGIVGGLIGVLGLLALFAVILRQ
jgi:putative membrane protein